MIFGSHMQFGKRKIVELVFFLGDFYLVWGLYPKCVWDHIRSTSNMAMYKNHTKHNKQNRQYVFCQKCKSQPHIKHIANDGHETKRIHTKLNTLTYESNRGRYSKFNYMAPEAFAAHLFSLIKTDSWFYFDGSRKIRVSVWCVYVSCLSFVHSF